MRYVLSLAVPLIVLAAPAHAQDLLHCSLSSRAYELGAPGDGEPSAPVVLGDAVAVAFTRGSSTGAGSDLLVQRVLADGTLAPAVVVRSGVHFARPILVGAAGHAYVLAVRADGASEAVPLDPATGGASATEPPIALDVVPEDASIGARGLVTTQSMTTRDHRRLVRRTQGPAGTAHDAHFPAPRSWPATREQLLASGTDLDAVLVRAPGGVWLGVMDAAGTEVRSRRLFTGSTSGGTWSEASIAAGPSGIALVRTGPGIGDLALYLVHRASDVAALAPLAIPPPAGAATDALVRRYPRVASLAGGWAISYWDGIGPSLVRVDAAGALTADAMPVRSGDERGGHTDACMVATDGAIAMSWQVGPPMMDHGFPEEQPRRPGPRLAILRCTP